MTVKFSQFNAGGAPITGDIIVGLRADENTQFVYTTTGDGSNISIPIMQTGHGFTIGQVVYFNGTEYVLSQANLAATADVIGIVSAIVDANTFILSMGGQISGFIGLIPGDNYFLSATTAGGITNVKPTGVGEIEKPILMANSTTTAVFYNERGKIIPTPLPVGFTWNIISANTVASPNNGYICNSASTVTVTLPTSCAIGAEIAVTNYGTGNFVLAQNAGQSVNVYSSTTTVGTGGSGTSLSQGTMVTVICVVANTGFMVIDTEGYLAWV